jgi:hypothetical protein
MSDNMASKTVITTDKSGNTLIKSSALLKALSQAASNTRGGDHKPSPHVIPGV